MILQTKSVYEPRIAGDPFPTVFERLLNGDDYDNGVVEGVARTARNNSQALGRLVEVLYRKYLLNVEDIAEILDPVATDVVGVTV